jgi:hypothetical protein
MGSGPQSSSLRTPPPRALRETSAIRGLFVLDHLWTAVPYWRAPRVSRQAKRLSEGALLRTGSVVAYCAWIVSERRLLLKLVCQAQECTSHLLGVAMPTLRLLVIDALVRYRPRRDQ